MDPFSRVEAPTASLCSHFLFVLVVEKISFSDTTKTPWSSKTKLLFIEPSTTPNKSRLVKAPTVFSSFFATTTTRATPGNALKSSFALFSGSLLVSKIELVFNETPSASTFLKREKLFPERLTLIIS